MSADPFNRRPFVAWSIDRWKVTLIILLFALLLTGALLWPPI